MIFDVVGTPSEEDQDFITDGKAMAYIKAFPNRQPKDLQMFYSASPPPAVDLLGKFLIFNPDKRLTLEDAIYHEYFSQMRDTAREHQAVQQEFEWDNDPDISIMKLREHFMQEVENYRAL
jgi:mitogen-activated protein kinase 1/3